MNKKVIIIIVIIIVLAIISYFVWKNISIQNKRKALFNILSESEKNNYDGVFEKMTDQEIIDSYDWVINKSKDTELQKRIAIISTKYNIFT